MVLCPQSFTMVHERLGNIWSTVLIPLNQNDHAPQCENKELGTVEEFFNEIMAETHTIITWPMKLKPGTKSKKDPHIRITGAQEDILSAKDKILDHLDSRKNRVTLKMDVAYTDHSHIIGKGGRSIQKVMNETGCHIHFPDSNRTNTIDKSNQVSIAGTALGAEQARCRIRELLPLSVHFELSIVGYNKMEMFDHTSPAIQTIQQTYSINIRSIGKRNVNIRSIMQSTGVVINFPDPVAVENRTMTTLHGSLIVRKSTVMIKGPCFDSVVLAWQELLGYLQLIVLIFDLKEGQQTDAALITQLMKDYEVTILIKQKPKQNSGRCMTVRGAERDSRMFLNFAAAASTNVPSQLGPNGFLQAMLATQLTNFTAAAAANQQQQISAQPNTPSFNIDMLKNSSDNRNGNGCIQSAHNLMSTSTTPTMNRSCLTSSSMNSPNSGSETSAPSLLDLSPPPNRSLPAIFGNFSVSDTSNSFSMARVLTRLGLAKYIDYFQRAGIDFNTFLNFNDADLEELGIPYFGRRSYQVLYLFVNEPLGNKGHFHRLTILKLLRAQREAENYLTGILVKNRFHLNITSFYRNKSVFVTGATGFLGKVLVEKSSDRVRSSEAKFKSLFNNRGAVSERNRPLPTQARSRERRKGKGPDAASKLPMVTPHIRCRLNLQAKIDNEDVNYERNKVDDCRVELMTRKL
uniref:K Homology domain-containing protein n=1 Tax=Tetranychus urticae TaxID=32264 RepID=T1JUY8_TETUR